MRKHLLKLCVAGGFACLIFPVAQEELAEPDRMLLIFKKLSLIVGQ
ncbi:hypothetical protein [Photobacterium sp. 1_MG-2023]|nr:hypothetical protein [Photobacterium sp. 1_MG-2023]MDO6704942.1 hypothetical protein [Photobacterium sp. 1_MG-2023]